MTQIGSPPLVARRSWLDRYAVLHTRAFSELSGLLAGKGIRVEIERNGRDALPLDARINAVYQPNLYLGYLDYGAALRIHVPPTRSVYSLSVGTWGEWRSRVGSRETAYGTGLAALTSPGRDETVITGEGCRRLQFALDRDAVVSKLAALLDRPIHRAPIFDSSIDLFTPSGRALLHTLLFVAHELELQGPATSAAAASDIENYLIARLLLSVPHTWSAALSQTPPAPSPAGLRRAVDYIHAHAAEPVAIEALARAAGVSGRTLFRHFRLYRGMSPFAYLRSVRLARARDDLVAAECRATVTEIAGRWGFANLGRFAIEYRRQFGESPSATRSRGHRH
jgi:AraC-like DNA-binding protein